MGIDLKFSKNVLSLVLGKVRNFQHRSSSRFRDILEKPEGWMKTPPPRATNRVNVWLLINHIVSVYTFPFRTDKQKHNMARLAGGYLCGL